MPGKDGATLRHHLSVVWRATGRRPPELDVPGLPAQAAHLWDIFHELAAARGGNGYAANPVDWKDLAAWQQVCGVALTPWEAETLIHLDRAVRAIMAKD